MWLKNLGIAALAIVGLGVVVVAGLAILGSNLPPEAASEAGSSGKLEGTVANMPVPPALGDLPAGTTSKSSGNPAEADSYIAFVAAFSEAQTKSPSAYKRMTEIYLAVPEDLATRSTSDREKLVRDWTASITAITAPSIAALKAIEVPKLSGALQAQVTGTLSGRDRLIMQMLKTDEAVKRLGVLVMGCTPANNDETFNAIELQFYSHRGDNSRDMALTNFNLAANLPGDSPGRGILAAHAYFNDSISALFDVRAKRLSAEEAASKIDSQIVRMRASVLKGRSQVKLTTDQINAELARSGTLAKDRVGLQSMKEIYADYSLAMDELDQAIDMVADIAPLLRKNDEKSWASIDPLLQQSTTLQAHSMNVSNNIPAKLSALPD